MAVFNYLKITSLQREWRQLFSLPPVGNQEPRSQEILVQCSLLCARQLQSYRSFTGVTYVKVSVVKVTVTVVKVTATVGSEGDGYCR